MDDLFGPFLSFQFLLNSTHDILENIRRQVKDEKDRAHLNGMMQLFFITFLSPFASNIIKNKNKIGSGFSIVEIEKVMKEIEAILPRNE